MTSSCFHYTWRAPKLVIGELWYRGWCIHSDKSAVSWWRHQMETFSVWLAFCVGNSPVTGEFPTQRPVTRSFDVVFYLRPQKRLSKQWRRWWFKTPSRSLWRHCNGCARNQMMSPRRWWSRYLNGLIDRLIGFNVVFDSESLSKMLMHHWRRWF